MGQWGIFYETLMPVVWDAVGKEECEGSLNFYRINDVGVHDPDRYYYLWIVTGRRSQ